MAAGAALVTGAGLLIGLLVALGGHRAGAAGPGRRGSSGAAAGSSLPAGDRWLAVPAATATRTAGFMMAVPASWHVLAQEQSTTVRSPAGNLMLTASPVPSVRSAVLAGLLQRRALAAQPLPGYQTGPLRYLAVAGAPAATWTAHWRAPGAGLVSAQEVTFSIPTAAGRQVYRLRLSGPGRSWAAGQAVLAAALRTLRVPGQ